MDLLENGVDFLQSLAHIIIETVSDTERAKPILEMGSSVIDASIPGFKLGLELISVVRVQRFKSFLLGISRSCEQNQDNGVVLKEKLLKLADKQVYQEFICDAYESAMSARSIKNAGILGFYLSQNAFLKEEITVGKLAICHALKELADIETDIFIHIYNSATKKDNLRFFESNHNELGAYDKASVELVIEALKNSRIVGRGFGSFEYTESAHICLLGAIADEAYELISGFTKPQNVKSA